MKHTPGPWVAEDEHQPNYESYTISGQDSNGTNTIIAHGVHARQMPIITAAPELLEALQGISHILENHDGDDPDDTPFIRKAFEAIAKATAQ